MKLEVKTGKAVVCLERHIFGIPCKGTKVRLYLQFGLSGVYLSW